MNSWRFVIVGSLVLLGAVVSTRPAAAEPPPAISSPMDCINRFDDENLDYVGDGWVDALVSATNGISLRCGDERSGVVHCAHRFDWNDPSGVRREPKRFCSVLSGHRVERAGRAGQQVSGISHSIRDFLWKG